MKLAPAIKQVVKQAQDTFSKVDTKTMQNKFQQAVQFMKKKMQDLKKSTQNNEIAVKVTNRDAQKQISQIQKQIDSLQEKINARQMKLNIITPKLDEITSKTTKAVTPEGVSSNNSAIQQTIDNSLAKNKEYNSLIAQEEKMTQEIAMYNNQLNEAKSKMTQLKQEINQTGTSQNKLASFFNAFKGKLDQAKLGVNGLKNIFTQMPKLTQNITNNIKNMGSGLKQGLGHVLKYAGALFSLRGIYSVLSSCASTWLSSQNVGAKQLSDNIDYMKYAMGSAFAPVIQWVTNLVYNLMKAIQSVVYALFRVNIFANASAKSYSAMAGNAKKAKQETKQLAGIHDEINNIQNNDNADSGNGGGGGATPNLDLSDINPSNSILDAIKNGDWYLVGALIAEKINKAMENIPWDKIQNGARKIATNIGNFVNGFVDKLDWNLLGYTIGQGVNTAFIFANTLLTTINWRKIGSSYATFLNSAITTIDWNLIGKTFSNGLNAIFNVAYGFVTTFDWKNFGKAISTTINGFFKNTDWKTIGRTFSEGISGILEAITGALSALDWGVIVEAIIEFFEGLDFSLITNRFFEALGAALGSFANLLVVLDEKKQELIDGVKEWFSKKLEECGGNAVEGFFKGIGDALKGIGQWIIDNIFTPFINGFKNAFGIHSPSTVMQEQGTYIIQGLFNGIQGLVGTITQIWKNMKETAIQIFNNVKEKIQTIWNAIKTFASSIWTGIKNVISSVINSIKTTISNVLNAIKTTWQNIWNAIKTFALNIWTEIKNVISSVINVTKNTISNVLNTIKNTWQNIWNGIKAFALNIWNGIKNIFSGVGSWFSSKFQQAYNGIRNVFSSIGSFFSGIWGNIKNTFSSLGTSIGNAISGAVKSGINGVISLIQNTINGAIRLINGGINLINLIPGVYVGHVGYLSLPRLAKGGVLTQETAFIGGEYSGASSNPEIVTPQNIMYDTMRKALSDSNLGNNNDRPIYLTVNINNKKLGQILLDDLRDMKRQTGNGLEALVGG